MLTSKETDILHFIRSYAIRHGGQMPTLQEIGDALQMANRGNVSRYLSSMAAKGVLVRRHGHRGYALVDEVRSDAFILPLVGKIAAGQPIEAIEGYDQINLYELLLGEGRYLLQVDGDSLIEIGILPGDFVVMQQQNTAENGDIVAALIDDHESTLKKFQKGKGDIIELHPANIRLQTMTYTADRVQIQGKLVAQLRSYQ